MLRALKTKNIGPMTEMELEFGAGLNVFTGDNGLGKSFLLDIIWFSLTGSWPHEVNPKLTQGYMVKPHEDTDGTFSVLFEAQNVPRLNEQKDAIVKTDFTFDYTEQSWKAEGQTKNIDTIVIYAMADGSFAVFDPLRKGNDKKIILTWSGAKTQPSSFVFSAQEIWDGIQDDANKWLCNGLIRDWANWQREGGEKFDLLKKVLLSLSPKDEPITIGKLTRISVDDIRDIPTINMPYGQIPVLYASSGIKRALAIAYLLSWTGIENAQAAKLVKREKIIPLVFLADEIEAHLHPKWQRSIAQSLLVNSLHATETLKSKGRSEASFQEFMTTHSPLAMASLEGYFQSKEGQKNGAWFDIDLDATTGKVEIQERGFVSYGSASNWLTSKAFDLKSDASLDREFAEEKVLAFLSRTDQTEAELHALVQDIGTVLSDIDPIWLDLRDFCRAKGWEL